MARPGSRPGSNTRFAPSVARLGALVVSAFLLAHAEPATAATDPALDTFIRPMVAPAALDPGDPAVIDLLETLVDRWRPDDPSVDLFIGGFASAGRFARIDLRFKGLANPPGPIEPQDYDPFRFGAAPVFGFVEFDMDQLVTTGGELDAITFRYTANVARFGGLPSTALQNQVARNDADLDGDFLTAPVVERSGEEFHIAFLGSSVGQIGHLVADEDGVFESGEIWQVSGSWFHRAHGYEPFSLAVGGERPGAYTIHATLRFAHDPILDETTVSAVLPLSNQGAAMIDNVPPQPPDGDCSNQASVHEALLDLRTSAQFLEAFPSGLPEEVLITEWRNNDAGAASMGPDNWRVTALLGTARPAAADPRDALIWTDCYPNPLRGDFNADGVADGNDLQLLTAWSAAHDASDGAEDGMVVLPLYPLEFTVYDVNFDGIVDEYDAALVATVGDLNGDLLINMADFAALQRCAAGNGVPPGGVQCAPADLDTDLDVDMDDLRRFLPLLDGGSEDD